MGRRSVRWLLAASVELGEALAYEIGPAWLGWVGLQGEGGVLDGFEEQTDVSGLPGRGHAYSRCRRLGDRLVQFEYGRFQRSYEKTRISTDFGTMGTAHSEYLGPLSEAGILGLLSILFVIGSTLVTGIRVYYTSRKRSIKIFSLAVLIGLTSYYFHGLLNNFLDTDKISVLFWGYTAMLVAMDVYHRDTPEEKLV